MPSEEKNVNDISGKTVGVEAAVPIGARVPEFYTKQYIECELTSNSRMKARLSVAASSKKMEEKH